LTAATAETAPPHPVRRGGRPSREAAAQLGETILDAATELFLADGYGDTSVETVALRAGISKRTFYHRFADKQALFAAVVHRIIERLRPPAEIGLFEGDDVEQVLRLAARLMLHAAVTPEVLALHRLILAEAARFPELAAALATEGAAEVMRELAAIFERETASGKLSIANPEFAAAAFMQLVVAVPQRRALGLGQKMTAAELDAWANDAVTLFLDGSRRER
jgi:AcrR family transcriptional regulator